MNDQAGLIDAVSRINAATQFPFISVHNGNLRNEPTAGYFMSGFEVFDAILDSMVNLGPEPTRFYTSQHTNGSATVTIDHNDYSRFTEYGHPVPCIEVRVGESREDDVVGAAITVKVKANVTGNEIGGPVKEDIFGSGSKEASSLSAFSFTLIPTAPGCICRIWGWMSVDGKIKMRPFIIKSSSNEPQVIVTNNFGPTTLIIPGVDDPFLVALKHQLASSIK